MNDTKHSSEIPQSAPTKELESEAKPLLIISSKEQIDKGRAARMVPLLEDAARQFGYCVMFIDHPLTAQVVQPLGPLVRMMEAQTIAITELAQAVADTTASSADESEIPPEYLDGSKQTL